MDGRLSKEAIEISARENTLRKQLLGLLVATAFLLLPFAYIWHTIDTSKLSNVLMFGGALLAAVIIIFIFILQILLVPTSATIYPGNKELSIHFHFLRSERLLLKDISQYTTTGIWVDDERCSGIFIYTHSGGRYLISDRYVVNHLPVKALLADNGVYCPADDEEYNETRFVKVINEGVMRLLYKIEPIFNLFERRNKDR